MTNMHSQYYQSALEVYRNLNDSPMQRRLREEAPVLVGAVYWNPQRDNADTIRYELTRMRKLGFTYVRFHCVDPVERADGTYDFSYANLRMDIAHEVGLKVCLHYSASTPSSAVLKEEGLTREEAKALGPDDPRVLRAIRHRLLAVVANHKDHPALGAWPLSGEPPATGIPLGDDSDKQRFTSWLQAHYATPRAVHAAWLIYPDVAASHFNETGRNILCIDTWEDAVNIAMQIRSSGSGSGIATTSLHMHELFGTYRDLVRYRADETIRKQVLYREIIRELDKQTPILIGNHQLLYNNGQLAWDQMGIARVADCHYTSIHLSWHFESVKGEFERPHYIQSRLTSDAFKGAYTSAFETTGGPVQYSGGYGNSMDAGLMRKLMLNFLAAGNEGIAFWAWIARPGGIEAGEYGLVSLSGKITEWAEEASRIIAAMTRHRREIWAAGSDAEVAIVRSWDTETIMACEPRRFDLMDGPTPFSSGPAQQHIRALIGASRAAINEQVAFQYVTVDELMAGIAGVYPAIYLPHVRCISDEALAVLQAYVEAGGHLIADVQIGFEDQWGKVRTNGAQGAVAACFGAWIDNIHDSRTRPQTVDGMALPGFFGDIQVTTARVLQRFDTGKPAVAQARIGRGLATLIAFDPARNCWEPGNTVMERYLAGIFRGNAPRRFTCDVPMTFRRNTPEADHYFVINDGPARSALLRVHDRTYTKIEDVLAGTTQEHEGAIAVAVDAYSGAWLRCART